ncbi:MAG: 5'/3'-nucleotidase SurE [Planctomycetia bacterium]|nr:5'/3'-nucleotidase SurE [Planctomycetia bacterium]
MIVLLTNDDGIDAPGLAALAAACRGLACRAVVVAPKDPHSGCGHRVTTDRPLRLEPAGPDRFHVDGTPADCVRLALTTLLRPALEADAADAPPRPVVDWVLSGINAGGNLGVDIHHSGTVAAAREAALHGVRALAASHYQRREESIDWNRAAAWMAGVLAEVLPLPLEGGEFWNVNLPHPVGAGPAAARPPLVECRIDPSPLPLGYVREPEGWRYRSRYQERRRVDDGDVATCFGGAISLSRGRVV